MTEFPTHPDEVQPDWIGARLREAGLLEGGEVASLRWEPIGTGQVGDSVRFHLSYSVPGQGPATLAGKFPASDPTSRATAAMLGLYLKEVTFYRELATKVAIRSPRALVAEIDPNRVDFVLLFEDLGPARGGNQLASCSAGDAREAIGQAAALHGPSWNLGGVVDHPILAVPVEIKAQFGSLYAQAHAVFRERYADSLEPEFMTICDRLCELRELQLGRVSPSTCLIHGDFRLDNMLFDIRDGREAIAVLDWQTVSAGNGLTDIGYFMGTGIGNELRRAHERDLLELYCAEMTSRGVPMSLDAIWDDYVIGALSGISTAVFSAAFVERTERGDANFLSMARGACALAQEHGSLEVLKG